MSWRDPGQNEGFWCSFLVHWDLNLPSNVEKWTFWCHVRPNPANVRETSCVCSVRSHRTPLDLPNFNLNYQKTSFCEKLDFPRFTNRSLGRCVKRSTCEKKSPLVKREIPKMCEEKLFGGKSHSSANTNQNKSAREGWNLLETNRCQLRAVPER